MTAGFLLRCFPLEWFNSYN